jgi:hypothetical protein
VSLKVVSSTQLNITRTSSSSAFHELSQGDGAYNYLYYPLQCRWLCAMALETIEGQRGALQDVMRQRLDYDRNMCQALKAKENSLPLCPRFHFSWSNLLISLDTPQLMSFGDSECTYPSTPRSLFRSVSSKLCSRQQFQPCLSFLAFYHLQSVRKKVRVSHDVTKLSSLIRPRGRSDG